MEKKDSSESPWWRPGVILFTRMSGWIAGPIIIAIFVGKYLDQRYNTEPWLFLLSVGFAFFVSTFGIVKDAMQALKEIDSAEKGGNKNENIKNKNNNLKFKDK